MAHQFESSACGLNRLLLTFQNWKLKLTAHSELDKERLATLVEQIKSKSQRHRESFVNKSKFSLSRKGLERAGILMGIPSESF